MRRRNIIWLTAAAVMLALILAGCVAEGQTISFAAAPQYFGQFQQLYPNEYASFVADGMDKGSDGQVHSHAASRAHTEADTRLPDSGAACLSCKTADFNTLYAEYGMEVFSMSYQEVSGEVVEYWSCRTCHASGVPAANTDATIVTYTSYRASPSKFLQSVDPVTASCGQCHNATCTYPRYSLGKTGTALEDYDPWKYGADADGMRQAAEEYGIAAIPDLERGVDVFYLGHPDLELFQGSVHQELGMTCADCHMPTVTAQDGSTYVSHNASSSPLDSEEAMRSCLDCHAELGVSNTVEMRKYVRQKQADMAQLESDYLERLDALWTRITDAQAAGSADTDTLAAAKQAYADARYYYTFEHAEAREPGLKISHSPDAMRDYIARGNARMDEAFVSLEPQPEQE
ncbi:MAG: ammonia-forming cytochrome c nitrite reductase subunit c552 [Coriobacteriales bacterium]|jgi:nitrite reductase (cytochrome c-552)|nr:ammonia-forming cytochrome c nitrite reductase subunit c552 [Coriobacteriales bacterium]